MLEDIRELLWDVEGAEKLHDIRVRHSQERVAGLCCYSLCYTKPWHARELNAWQWKATEGELNELLAGCFMVLAGRDADHAAGYRHLVPVRPVLAEVQ